jgi:HSP20 family protein
MARQWPTRSSARPLTLRDAMNRLFEDATVGGALAAARSGVTAEIDVHETEDEYVLTASLPGVKPDDVEITVMRDTVTIRGETRQDEEIREEQYLYRERSLGSFARSITLPEPIQADAADATFENGILKLRLPKSEDVKPRRIEIGGREQSAIRVGQGSGETQQQQGDGAGATQGQSGGEAQPQG